MFTPYFTQTRILATCDAAIVERADGGGMLIDGAAVSSGLAAAFATSSALRRVRRRTTSQNRKRMRGRHARRFRHEQRLGRLSGSRDPLVVIGIPGGMGWRDPIQGGGVDEMRS
jgi:hypothetical protein